MSSPSLTLPSQERPVRRRLLEILGALTIAATYIYLVLNQPTDITGGPGSASALVALSGFLAGAVLLIIAVLPTLPASTLVLIPVVLVLNIVLGQFVRSTVGPLYLDAVRSLLVGRRQGRQVEQAEYRPRREQRDAEPAEQRDDQQQPVE